MESKVRVQEEEERVAEHQKVRVWGAWNPHGYPVVHGHENDGLYCYTIQAHLCKNTNQQSKKLDTKYCIICLNKEIILLWSLCCIKDLQIIAAKVQACDSHNVTYINEVLKHGNMP